MIYIVGSDLESENGKASLDIGEMMESGVNTDKNNILIYTGGASKWQISDIPTDSNNVYRLNGENFEPVKSYSALNMGDSNTLSEFIKYSMSTYPADSYGLILWNHGGGPIIGYGADELHGDLLTLTELKSAFSSAGLGSGKKLEFLGFDACLMGSVETAWMFKDYANYMIASEEVEPGWGWNYGFLSSLDKYDSGKDIGVCIVDEFFKASDAYIKENPNFASDLTLSCMDLSQVSNLEKCINDVFKQVDNSISNGSFPVASRVRNDTKSFGKFGTDYSYDLVDLGHIAALLSSQGGTDTAQLQNAINSFVCYSKSNVTNATGVSIYHPYDNKDDMNDCLSVFNSFGFAPAYTQYINDFGSMLKNGSSESWKSFRSMSGSAEKKKNENELSIKLTKEQAANYASSNYFVLKKLNEEEYLFIFSGFDTQLDSDGTLSASYSGKAVFAIDEKSKQVSEEPITMYQIHDGGTETKYVAPSMFWKTTGEISDWKTNAVQWQIKLENGKPQLLGAYLIGDEADKNMPQKNLLNYKDYDLVEFSFSSRKPKRDANGNILPYFDWDSSGKFYGNQFEVKTGFHLEIRDIDDKSDYYVMFVVKDTQGNKFASEMFKLP